MVYSRARSITLRPGQNARSIRGRELNKARSNQGNTVSSKTMVAAEMLPKLFPLLIPLLSLLQ